MNGLSERSYLWRPRVIQGAADVQLRVLQAGYQIDGDYCTGDAHVEFTDAGSTNNPICLKLPVSANVKPVVSTGAKSDGAIVVGFGSFIDTSAGIQWAVQLMVPLPNNTMTFPGLTPKGGGAYAFLNYTSGVPLGNGGGSQSFAVNSGDLMSVQFRYATSGLSRVSV